MPTGKIVPRDTDLSIEVTQMPFDHGAITHTTNRGRKIIAHRIIADGKVVACIANSDSKTENVYLVGERAIRRLTHIARDGKLNSRGVIWTQAQVELVLRRFPDAIIDRRRVRGLVLEDDPFSHIEARDLAALTREIADRPAVIAALSVESGIVIEHAGSLPQSPDEAASGIQAMVDAFDSGVEKAPIDVPRTYIIGGNEATIALLREGSASLVLWVQPGMDPSAILANASAVLRMTPPPVEDLVELESLPKGIEVTRKKGGVESLIRLLDQAAEIEVSGAIVARTPERNAVSLLLVGGVPRALHGAQDLETGLQKMTDSAANLVIERIDGVARLALVAETSENFDLQNLLEMLPSTRTKREDKIKLRRALLEEIIGFHVGIERLDRARTSWKQAELSGLPVMVPMEQNDGEKSLLIADKTEEKVRLEEELVGLERTVARKDRRLNEASATHTRLREETDVLRDEMASSKDRAIQLEQELELSRAATKQAESAEEEAQKRNERLARRVSELELAVAERVEEVAKAIAGAGSAEELGRTIDRMAREEAELRADVRGLEENLRDLTLANDSAERLHRVLDEQIESTRNRLRVSGAELDEALARSDGARGDLEVLEAEIVALRRRHGDEINAIRDLEIRSAHIQNDLRDLLEQRRVLLREIGDIEARRSREGAELRSLIEESKNITDAHEEALRDISEAERLRSKLLDEPLGQALLGADHGFAALSPVLQRIDESRQRGYSIVLLDRAVERGLRVIQATVDEVASTPRNLLAREVLELLETQAPETAGAVRGLTRWSVQNRLQYRLGECVQLVVLEIEAILDEYDEAITMLRRLNGVIAELARLGTSEDILHPLEGATHRPEVLPIIARRVREHVQRALDRIYLDADRQDRGELALDQTADALEALIDLMDASGLTGEIPPGRLWSFQRSGILSFEELSLTERERPPVDIDMVEDMRPFIEGLDESSLEGVRERANDVGQQETPRIVSENEDLTTQIDDNHLNGWDDLGPPDDRLGVDDASIAMPKAPVSAIASAEELDELAQLDSEIDRLDREAKDRVQEALMIDEFEELQEEEDADEAVENLRSDLEDIDL